MKQLRRLARKYPSVLRESEKLVAELRNDKRPGDKIPNVGYDVYKVRLPNRSAKRGKSGGFRVIYFVQLGDHVILLTVYSKTNQQDIPAHVIGQIVTEVLSESDDEET